MCGIAGFIHSSKCSYNFESVARSMVDSIAHRGPDSSGVWVDQGVGVALAHRRLSIIDLTSAGQQPMISLCGRYVLVFNGEIYNHLEIRALLSTFTHSPQWKGQSDTETLITAISILGVERALQAAVGMFAFALWDRTNNELTLARDRMGEKPIYYGWSQDGFIFGSELKALKRHPTFSGEIDRGALSLLLRYNYIPAPYCIYQGFHKLSPAHFVTIPLCAGSSSNCTPKAYWDFNKVVSVGLSSQFSGTATQAAEVLEDCLLKSVGQQMVADVPLGAFLSGGIDSSTVAALMQVQSNKPIKTFTIGFDVAGLNEAVHAKAVAEHLGTDHTELYVTPEDALKVIPTLSSVYCEPFSDSSQIPTLLVSRIAREYVSVALSGDGGDELFGGYNRYLVANNTWPKIQRLPLFCRVAGASFLNMISVNRWDLLFDKLGPLLPHTLRIPSPGDKAHKLASVLLLDDGESFYRSVTSQCQDPSAIIIGGCEPSTTQTDSSLWPESDSLAHWMMAMDSKTYLPDDILVKVDRAGMAYSLETRLPFLDHRVVELAWQMPLHYKIKDGQGKWLLREVLYKYVPRELVERPKQGFSVPLSLWLRGPLKDWAECLLDPHALKDQGYFNVEAVQNLWAVFVAGNDAVQYRLWTILMFQAWLMSV